MQVFDMTKYFIRIDKQSDFGMLNDRKQDYGGVTGLYYVSGVDEHNAPLYRKMTKYKLLSAIEDLQEMINVLRKELPDGEETTKLP